MAEKRIWFKENPEPCEGCGKAATGQDSEGVPLCDDCLSELVKEYENGNGNQYEPTEGRTGTR